ncbi:MAG: cation-translocating P-type ATPase [Ramlibacter sp.]
MLTAIPAQLSRPGPQSPAWSALDEPEEWQGFSRPVAGRAGLWESYLAIDGMHCAGCTLAVEKALGDVTGVQSVDVNGASGIARLVWRTDSGRPSAWLAALRTAGYGAVPAGDQLAAAPRQRAQRLMLWQWLVAGFCMMQVMMYTLPVYVTQPGEIAPDILALLRWAAWILTLPVVLFSCRPFFSAAARDLRNGSIGMDVPVALGVIVTFAASTAATFDPAGPFAREVWYDSLTMFVFFLLSGRLLEQRLRDRTAGSLEALMRRLPDTVEQLGADGAFHRVAVRRLVAGDLVRVMPGEVIPADGTVTKGSSRLDEAMLTGESRPLLRSPGAQVLAGSHNLTGELLVRLTQTGGQTRFAGIVALMEQASADKPRLARLADRIARPFLLLVLLASAGAMAWWWHLGAAHAVGVAVAVLIVTCPCALSLATPAATLAAAGALARRGIMVRRLQALESAADVDTVIFDKTGTLTQDRMQAALARWRPGTDAQRIGGMASAIASRSLHPAARAVASSFAAGDWSAGDITETAGSGVHGRVCRPGSQPLTVRLGSAAFCGAPAPNRVAEGAAVHLADAEGWLATFELDEALRPDAAGAVLALRAQGVDVQMLSGDQMTAARRLASAAGIETWQGGQSPEDKLARMQFLQQDGHRVAMVGDGMNDGPVLARADLSIAMGHAVPLAQAQADVVVPGDRLAAVPAFLAHARRTRRIVRQNLAWAAIYNAVCVPLAMAGAMPAWAAGLGMAASSLLVVLNSARLARCALER